MSAHSQPDPAGGPQPPEIVDAELIPDPPVSLELVRRERRSEVIKPLDAAKLVESFAAYQALLPQLLDDSDYQGTGSERFVKKSGWRKIATAFDLDVKLIHVRIERDENDTPARAEVWARAIAPSGRSMDADGYCSVSEPRFAKAAGRQKLENDLPATAATRAKNRAISDLVGMGAVSAEEVDAGTTNGTAGPAYGPALPADAKAQLPYKRALGTLVPPAVASSIWGGVIETHGYMPQVLADLMLTLARALQPEEATV